MKEFEGRPHKRSNPINETSTSHTNFTISDKKDSSYKQLPPSEKTQLVSPTTKEHSSNPVSEYSETSPMAQRLYETLPDIASELITKNQDMSHPVNQSFATHPDNPVEHAPKWHQYGITTHSREFGKALQIKVPEYIQKWKLTEQIEKTLATEIDGVPKKQLLQLVPPLHDIGKYTARKITIDTKTGMQSTTFEDHEEHSGRIIRNELRSTLQQSGLNDSHIEYVATCAELHFELGKVRRTAGGDYTMAFTESSTFTTAIHDIMNEHPDYALEIGLQFIADTLSKTEVAATANTDEGIAAQRASLEAEIIKKDLNPNLINQALQQPVNLKVAQKYLQEWAARFGL